MICSRSHRGHRALPETYNLGTFTSLSFLLALVAVGVAIAGSPAPSSGPALKRYGLLPFPQSVALQNGILEITFSPEIKLIQGAGVRERIGLEQLQSFFRGRHLSTAPRSGAVSIVIGSVESEKDLSPWLASGDLEALRGLNSQGYILKIGKKRIVIAGRTGLGTLYGVQTLLQMLRQCGPEMRLPLLRIVDYPEVPNRYVDMTFAWYSHYGAINFGFGTQLWGEQQWRWFIDWCLRHKINGIDLCIYGYWPFQFPKYPETILANAPVKTYDAGTENTAVVRITHPNIEHEFLPTLIRYAQDRGIRVNAYIGLNTFDGGYAREHPEARPFASESWDYMLDLSNAAAREYLRDSVRRIMQMGFDGVTFEMIELPSSVCTKSACIPKYWGGYEGTLPANSVPKLTPLPVRIRADADILNDLYSVITQVNPHADVGLIYHRIVELYGWSPTTLASFKQFRAMIPAKIYFLQGPRAPRNGPIEGSDYEKWVNIADPQTYRHSDNIGGDAAFYDRLLYVNNDPDMRGDDPVASLEWEIAQHRAAAERHLQGATGYGFEWYGDEIYPLILAQYSWRSSGPEGVPDHGFLEYASQSMYGDHVGTLVARLLALSPPPTDRYPSIWVEPANQAAVIARQALDAYSGNEPEYRKSLEELRTTTLRRAWLYDVERLQKAAEGATGSEKKNLLEQALERAKQVADLLLNGEPRLNYLDCYGEGGFRSISTSIQKLSGELGREVGDKYKAN